MTIANRRTNIQAFIILLALSTPLISACESEGETNDGAAGSGCPDDADGCDAAADGGDEGDDAGQRGPDDDAAEPALDADGSETEADGGAELDGTTSGEDARVDPVDAQPDAQDDGGTEGGADAQSADLAGDPCARSIRPDLLQTTHAARVFRLSFEGDRVVSLDRAGTWILWQASTRRALATGSTGSDYRRGSVLEEDATLDLQDGVFVVSGPGLSVDLRAAADGALIRTFPEVRGRSYLAEDASYLWSFGRLRSPDALLVWSIEGNLLVEREGSYFQRAANALTTSARAKPGELVVVQRDATTGAMEMKRIALPGGAVTSGPAYSGSFLGFFDDGSHFLTGTGGVVRVYASDGTQRQLLQLGGNEGSVGGHGEFVWAYGSSIGIDGSTTRVWRVGTADPVLVDLQDSPRYFQHGLLVLPLLNRATLSTIDENRFKIVDLRSDAPTTSTLEPPADFTDQFTGDPLQLATDAVGKWLLAEGSGLYVVQPGSAGSTTSLGCGSPIDIVGSEVGRVAIANADGRIRTYDLSLPDRPLISIIRRVVQPKSLDMTRDGTLLAAHEDNAEKTYQVFALPSGMPLARFDGVVEGELARAQSAVAVLSCTNDLPAQCSVRTTDANGQQQGAAIGVGAVATHPARPSAGTLLAVSADGRRIAVATNGSGSALIAGSIYVDGTLQGAAEGAPVGWVEPTRLLVNRVGTGASGGWTFTGQYLVDATGQGAQPLSTPALNARIREIDASRFYARGYNTIYSTTDGSLLWTGDSAEESLGEGVRWSAADLAGSYAVVAKAQGVVVTTRP